MLNFSKTAKKLMVFVLVLAMICPVLTYTKVATVNAATAKVSSVKITSLPSNTLTLAKGKSKVLKVAIATTASSVSKDYTFKSTDTKVATVTKATGGINVKAVAKGTSTIVVTSKADASKKAYVFLTVGTPVTSVKMNKTSTSILTGKNETLKVTVASKNASNTKVVWSSSNTAVATVSTSGKVVAKKAGTTTIKAVAADGSGKYAQCKVTVVNKNDISAIKILNPYTIKVALKYKQKISDANWVVKIKNDASSPYRSKSAIEYVENVNDKVYYINLTDEIYEYEYAQVLVKGLMGTSGYKSKEDRYDLDDKRFYDSSIKYYNLTKGKSNRIYLMSSSGQTVTISNLPKGLKIVNNLERNEFFLEGTPTQAGTFISKMTVGYGTENGGYTKDLVFMVSSPETMIVDSFKKYGIGSDVYKYSYSSSVKVQGGSGTYKFELLDKYQGMSVNETSGSYSVEIAEPGTYTYRIKVTDVNNSKLTATAKYTFVIEAAKELEIVMKDAEGNIVTDSTAKIYIYNRKTDTKYTSYYSTSGASEKTGSKKVYLSKGDYDIQVVMGNTYKMLVGKKVSASKNKVEIKVPAYRVTLTADDESTMDVIDDLYWYDYQGNKIFTGNSFFAKKGSYDLVGYNTYNTYTLKMDVNKTSEYKVIKNENVCTEENTSIQLFGNGNIRRFKFVPSTTGTYVFETQGGYDTYATLYNSSVSSLSSNDDGGVGYNFKISKQLTAGQTYYIDIKIYSTSVQTTRMFTEVPFSIKKQ